MAHYELNPDFKVEIVHLEAENEDVIIVDNFLKCIEPVVHFATHVAYLEPVGSDGTLFPGKRDVMPEPYYRTFRQLLISLQARGVFNHEHKALYLHRCKLSLVTQKACELTLLQRIPHIDSTDDNTFAAVHYLSGKESNGTSIYRYIPKNLIKITVQNQHLFSDVIEQTKNNESEHQGYLNNNTALFEQVINIKAKQNRVVLYKSNLLHCANLDNDYEYKGDIKNGRLSISSFFRVD